MTFSVVVPVLARTAEARADFDRALAALCRCDPPPMEVVVVDDGSPEPVRVDDAPGPPTRVLRQANAGPASARNAGAAVVTGDIIVFVDADIIVPPDTFARLAEGFRADPSAAAIWGTVTAAHPHPGVVSRYKNLTHRHFTLLQPRETRHLTTMLAAVRHDVFRSIGGFDTRLRTVSVEDVELGRTLFERGERVLLDRDLAAEHRHRFTFGGAIRNDFHKARHHARTTLSRRLRGDRSVALDGPGERRQLHYLLGVPLGVGALVAALAGRWSISAGLTAALVAWEADLWTYLRREQGLRFALACVPLLVVERVTVGAAVVAGVADVVWERPGRSYAGPHLSHVVRGGEGADGARAAGGRARPH
jgi:glycosyltransferase involved in cell wall biosynthesis